jgi:hypothetical protein
MSCGSQYTIPNTAGTSPDLVGNNTDTRSYKLNQASHTPDFSYPLISYKLFPSLSPSLFLVHNSTIIAEHKVKSPHFISPCHDHELILCTAYTKYSMHQIQHTPNTAYTKYSIHQIQHTPNTAYTKYSIHQIQHTPNTVYTKFSIHTRLTVIPLCTITS